MRPWSRFVAGLLSLLALCVARPSPAADDKPPLRLRVVGGLAALNQYQRHEEPFWTRELPALTKGRAIAEIVPFDRAGIRGQEMLRLVQLGAVPYGTALLSLVSTQDQELAAPDLAGLNPDIDSMRRSVIAFRPSIEKLLRERYGIEMLAIYIYPAQQLYCKAPFKSLSDIAGRRVRTTNPSQGDWVEALGAKPVQTGFAEIVANMRSGNIECAITGTMSGNTVGLHEVTTHIHAAPITWGLAVFVANGAAWRAVPADVQAAIRTGLPKLEDEIWAESARETGEGLACNTGAAACTTGRKGRMTLVAETPADRKLMREILQRTVLPRWVQRCGSPCVDLWRQTLGPVVGLEVR